MRVRYEHASRIVPLKTVLQKIGMQRENRKALPTPYSIDASGNERAAVEQLLLSKLSMLQSIPE